MYKIFIFYFSCRKIYSSMYVLYIFSYFFFIVLQKKNDNRVNNIKKIYCTIFFNNY